MVAKKGSLDGEIKSDNAHPENDEKEHPCKNPPKFTLVLVFQRFWLSLCHRGDFGSILTAGKDISVFSKQRDRRRVYLCVGSIRKRVQKSSLAETILAMCSDVNRALSFGSKSVSRSGHRHNRQKRAGLESLSKPAQRILCPMSA